nr:hypothetical protein [uncultured Desulfobacter sp.]
MGKPGLSSDRSVACLIVLYLLLYSGPAWAEAWPRSPGEIFFAPKVEYYETGHYWDRSGSLKRQDDKFKKLSIQPYVEYGLTGKDTLTGKCYFDFLDNGDSSTKGFSDLEVGYRRNFYNESGRALSAGLTALIPMGYAVYDTPSLGYGRFGVEASISAGYGWQLSERNGFAEAVARYRVYEGYPSDQVRGSLIFGQEVTGALQFILESELQWGLDNGDVLTFGDAKTVDGFYRLLKMTLHGRISITPDTSLVVSVFRHVWGENTGQGGGMAAAVWITF